MAQCIVTGGAGFIGSHLTDRLIADGHSVTVIDNLILGKKEFVHEDAVFHKADIRDFADIRPSFDGADAVFHLAAEPRLPLSIEDPIGTHEVNVTGTLNVLEAARQAGVKKFVFTSSAAVYGDEPLPIAADVPPNPKSPYGLHKYMGEQYARLYSALYDMDTVCLRYFNVYGPRKLAEGGYPMVIPIFLQFRLDEKPLTITGDGEQTRDYVHVSDVVQANISAWNSGVTDGSAYNIACSVQTSVNDIAAIIGGETSTIPARKGEVRFMQADIERTKKDLGWEPQVSLQDGLEELKQHWGVS